MYDRVLLSLLDELRDHLGRGILEEVAVEQFGRVTVNIAEQRGFIDVDEAVFHGDDRMLHLSAPGLTWMRWKRFRAAVRDLLRLRRGPIRLTSEPDAGF